MTESRPGHWFTLASAFLAVGGFCYFLGRVPGSAWLLPEIPHLESVQGSLLGWFPGWLPTYTHTSAFVLLSAAAWPGTRTRYLAYAIAWVAINLAFEFLQSPEVLAGAIRHIPWITGSSPPSAAVGLLSGGSFDPNDIAAAIAGGLTGFLILSTTQGDKR